jgi:hypothetical protein
LSESISETRRKLPGCAAQREAIVLGTLCGHANSALTVADIREDRGCAKHWVAPLSASASRCAVPASLGDG